MRSYLCMGSVTAGAFIAAMDAAFAGGGACPDRLLPLARQRCWLLAALSWPFVISARGRLKAQAMSGPSSLAGILA